MATTAERIGEVDIGRVVQRTFGVIGRNFALFAIVSLLLAGLPSLGIALLAPMGATALVSTPGGSTMPFAGFPWYLFLIGMVFGIAWMLISNVLQATLVRATLFDLAGKRADLGESLRIGLTLALPLLGLAILVSLGVGFASLLLLVPGIMLYCAWIVAVPALVEDRQGVFASLRRSRELTRGSRWKIFGLILIFIVIYWVLAAVVGLLARGDADAAGVSIVQAVLDALFGSVASMLGSAGIASLYVELRSAKEGATFEDLVDIFT